MRSNVSGLSSFSNVSGNTATRDQAPNKVKRVQKDKTNTEHKIFSYYGAPVNNVFNL